MKAYSKILVVSVIILALSNVSFAKAGKGFASAEEAGLKLMAMQQKGFIQLTIDEPSTFMQVEPLAWKGLMHKDKVNLVRTAMSFCNGLNQKGRKIIFVILQDMTSGKKLATGEVDRGRVDIYK